MENLNFAELHRELSREFFFYVDQKSRTYLEEILHFYWRARGSMLLGCASFLSGSKFLVTTDDPKELPRLVRKGLMVADHVIIRHDRLLPQTGWYMGLMPLDFAGFNKIPGSKSIAINCPPPVPCHTCSRRLHLGLFGPSLIGYAETDGSGLSLDW